MYRGSVPYGRASRIMMTNDAPRGVILWTTGRVAWGRSMKKGIFGAVASLLLMIGTAFAQTQAAPKTELEAFATSTGAVLLKGFTMVGSVSGAGQVTVNAMTFKNGSTGVVRTGLLIEVREVGGGL